MQPRLSQAVAILNVWYLSAEQSRMPWIDQPQGERSQALSRAALYRACIHKLPMRALGRYVPLSVPVRPESHMPGLL